MYSAKIPGLLILTLLFGSIMGAYSVVSAEVTLSKIDPLLVSYVSGGTDSRLHANGDAAYVFVALKPGYTMSAVNGLLSSIYAMGRVMAPLFVYGEVRRSSLLSLGSQPGVAHVSADVRLGFNRMVPDQDVYQHGLATDMYRVREIIGADRANELGVTGRGVTVAIVDTGTDFVIPDLQQAVARDVMGEAISFDPDGQSFVITNLIVHREGKVLRTSGLSVNVWNAASYVQTSTSTSPIEKIKLSFDYGAPSVASKSGDYHFGILRESVQDVVSSDSVTLDFPVVVVDSTVPHFYDTVFVDMSTAYYNFLRQYASRLNRDASQSLGLSLRWPAPNASWNDHSFSDEPPHKVGGTDFLQFKAGGDNAPNFSAGMLAFGVDLSGTTGRYFSLLPPIDPEGNFINVFFDSESHGTSTASSAASRGLLKHDIYHNGTLTSLPGIAPEAKVMGVKTLWLGEVTLGWYYAAGFDWNTTDSSFTYTGRHRADIISNSWGDSNPIKDLGSTFGADYMSQLADALSIPHYLDPSYPGTIMLTAGGNGGFGYGTTTSPAASTLAITVGASTSCAYRTQPNLTIKHEVAGSYDEVVPWSARGPTSIGEPKPDIVDVGAFGFTDQSTITGYGNVTKAFTIFGGTSMATPVTAGAIALLIQEYRDTHGGTTPPPDLVKSILASTASDLDYDPFTQGSGRVNVYDAVAAASEGKDARFPPRFYVQSNATWRSARELIRASWALNMEEPFPQQPMGTANWYAGIVPPGDSASASFSLKHTLSPKPQSIQFQLFGTKSYENSTQGNETWIPLPRTDIPTSTDLMKITLVYHFSDFANSTTWSYKNILTAQLYDVSANGSVRRINNAAPQSTTTELTVSRPLDKILGIPEVRVLEQTKGGMNKVPFALIIRYFARVSWSWITNLAVDGGILTATLSIPNSTAPGVYGGFISITDQDSQSLIPVSACVPIVAPGQYRADHSPTPYQNYAVYGAFDWGWRYEAGDWRTFALVVPEGVHKVNLGIKWSDTNTDIQAHLTSPLGYLVASSEFPTTKYVGSGKFHWSTSTGGPEEDISAADLAPGIYMLVLHNTLFGARSLATYPENFIIDVAFL